MKDQQKTKTELIVELQGLRERISELENPSENELSQKSGTNILHKGFSKNLLNTANALVVTLDKNARITLFNQYAQKFTGLSLNEVLGKNWFKTFIPKRDRPDVSDFFSDILSKMPDKNLYTNHIKTKNGDEKLISWNNSLMKDKHGNISGILSIGIDITKQNIVETALRESEEKFSNTVNLLPLGVFETDLEGNLTFVNEYALKEFGYSEKDIQSGLNIGHTLIYKNRAKVKKDIRKLISELKDSHSEYTALRKDGSTFAVLVYSTAIMQNKIPIGIRGTLIDISERKKTEETLRNSEEQLRLITDNTQDSIAITTFDLKATYLYVNPSVKSLLNYEPEELVGKSFFTFIHPEDKKQLLALGKNYLKKRAKNILIQSEKEYNEIIEYRFKNKEGNWRYLQSTVNIMNNKLLAVTRDITDRILEEKKMAESEEHFRSLFENNQAVMLLIDSKEGFVLDANPAACAYYGWKKTELVGMHMSEINTLSAQEIKEKIKAASTKVNNHFEFQHRLADQSIRDVEVYSGPVQIKDQNLLYSLIFDITERKKTEAALLKSENKYRTLFEKNADSILILRNQLFIDCNQATVDLMGYHSKQEFLELHPSQISPEKQADGQNSFIKAEEMMAIAYEQGSNRFEWEHLKKNGEVIPVEVLLTAIPSDKGDFLHALMRDISERKRAEIGLLTSENKMRMIVEGTPNLFFYTQNATAELTYISPAVEGITGRSVQEWMERKDWFVTNSPINELGKKATFGNLSGYTIESPLFIEIEHALGHTILLEIYENPIYENGTIVGLQGVAHDVTQRFKAEEALKASEHSFRVLFENSPLGTFITTSNGAIVDENSALLTILGSYSLEEIKKINVLEFPPFIENGYSDTFKKVVISRKVEFLKMNYSSLSEGQKTFSGYIIPLLDAQGSVEIVYTLLEDITERVIAEEENKKLEAQLRHSQKMETIGTLAGGIAHDFNNILAPILGFTELAMLKVDESNTIINDLKQVLSGVQRAKELVEQILLFSKQSDKERQLLSLQAIVKEALKLLRPSIPTTIEIKKHFSNDCQNVRADATQLHQVIVNLCTNAWQAMEQNGGGILTITLDTIEIDQQMVKLHPYLEEGPYVKLSVSDTGPGIDADTIERIFEPFFTTKTVDKGTGLGLSVVHGIVRSHKGDIQVQSEVGFGTTFNIYLPAIEGNLSKDEVTIDDIHGGSESILVVDDEKPIAEMVKTILENFDYKTSIYHTGAEAFECFERNPNEFHMLISDLTMPKMTGLDLADKLHSLRPELPIVIMTGFGDNLTKASQEHYGIKRVLTKPVAVKELALAVRKVLDNAKAEP